MKTKKKEVRKTEEKIKKANEKKNKKTNFNKKFLLSKHRNIFIDVDNIFCFWFIFL